MSIIFIEKRVITVADTKNVSPEFWRAVAWTVCYAFFMWVILWGLFNFNMFSVAHWIKVTRVELHGFPGFVFAILLLAAVPLYIATTVLTVRNKIDPIKALRPRCFDAPPKPEPVKPEPLVVEQDTLPELPAGVPSEMREVFAIAKKNSAVHQKSVFNRQSIFDNSPVTSSVKSPVTVSAPKPSLQTITSTEVTQPTPVVTEKDTITDSAGPLPIPKDFDTPSVRDNDVPIFSDINFDDDDDETEDEDTDTQNTPEYAGVQEFLSGAGYKTEMMGNLIVVDKFAIAVHNDDDFWVADELDWFAAGRQKPSPIVELENAKKEKKIKPILYVGENNIMDYDTVSAQWRDMGIQIVTNNDELAKAIAKKPRKKS